MSLRGSIDSERDKDGAPVTPKQAIHYEKSSSSSISEDKKVLEDYQFEPPSNIELEKLELSSVANED